MINGGTSKYLKRAHAPSEALKRCQLFAFSILPLKTSGLRALCGILILEAKSISVLRSQLPYIQAAPCWPKPSASTLLLDALRNVIPKVTRTWSTLSGRSTLLPEVDWSSWIRGRPSRARWHQPQWLILQSQRGYSWATWVIFNTNLY